MTNQQLSVPANVFESSNTDIMAQEHVTISHPDVPHSQYIQSFLLTQAQESPAYTPSPLSILTVPFSRIPVFDCVLSLSLATASAPGDGPLNAHLFIFGDGQHTRRRPAPLCGVSIYVLQQVCGGLRIFIYVLWRRYAVTCAYLVMFSKRRCKVTCAYLCMFSKRKYAVACTYPLCTIFATRVQ